LLVASHVRTVRPTAVIFSPILVCTLLNDAIYFPTAMHHPQVMPRFQKERQIKAKRGLAVNKLSEDTIAAILDRVNKKARDHDQIIKDFGITRPGLNKYGHTFRF
jgi:hypothetical protein